MLLTSSTNTSTIDDNSLQDFLDELDLFSTTAPKKHPSVDPSLIKNFKKDFSYASFFLVIFLSLLAAIGSGFFFNKFTQPHHLLSELLKEAKLTNQYLNEITNKLADLNTHLKFLELQTPPSESSLNPPFPSDEMIEPLAPPSTDFSIA